MRLFALPKPMSWVSFVEDLPYQEGGLGELPKQPPYIMIIYMGSMILSNDIIFNLF